MKELGIGARARRMALGPARAVVVVALLVGSGLLVAGCGPGDAEEEVEVVVPPGAAFQEVTDSLAARGLVSYPRLFRGLARIRGDDRQVLAGTYRFPVDAGWNRLLDDLVGGQVSTVAVTIPEGFTLREMAPRLAEVAGVEPDSALAYLEAPEREDEWDVPGPGLEGYLYPDTYYLAPGSSLTALVGGMVERYRSLWTEERRDRASELDLTPREVVTLASIVEAEARRWEEMTTIASVFHNRLELGYPLQADPTVLYALGGHRDRLLYAAIDSVADHPYNTYTQPGLPPGPIGAPGEQAVDAVLHPRETDYLYFVARPDGTHYFTRTLQEHNRARVQVRREWAEVEARTESDPSSGGSSANPGGAGSDDGQGD